MYNITDIRNILSSTEDCPKNSGDKICKKLKKGVTCFDTKLINQYQDIEYLLLRNNLSTDNIKCLIDRIHDLCEDCIVPTGVDGTTDSNGCEDGNIISESGDCLLTETGNNILVE